MSGDQYEKLYALLAEHLTERKRKLFDEVVNQRTRHLTVVLEDLYQAQNISAIQRSVESWGIQDLYVIENTHTFSHHRRIAKGANDWLTIHRFNDQMDNTTRCMEMLKAKGYQIAVTTLHDHSVSLQELDVSQKTAIVMGTELTGSSKVATEYADVLLHIPTYGFTESLNVGAATAVILQHLAEKIRTLNIPWSLSEREKLELKIAWAKKSIYWSKYLIDMFENGELNA
ncbi:MAG: RNA methyltransferase [Flavobacteriales bacterium]|nr:RNA methyltransferase [Flavobacteriales bacterium]